MRAIIIDDERTFAEMLAARLSLRGVTAEAVFSAADARKSFSAAPPDIAFLDVRLGGDDGLALLPELRAHWPDSDVIMLTGVTDMDAALLALRRGARNWLKKPVRLEDVLLECGTTETRLRQRRRQRRIMELDRLRLLGRVAEGVAHEVNNPLNIIMQAAGNVRDVLETAEAEKNSAATKERAAEQLFTQLPELLEDLRLIHSQSLRVRDMMRRLLLMGGGLDTRMEAVDVAAVAQTVLTEFTARLTAQGVRCHTLLPENLPHTRWSAQELAQVLRHVLENALDAMPQGGSLWLRAVVEQGEQAEQSLLFQVEDSGGGIAPDALPALFEPFFTTKDKGQGLGLAVCQSLMQMRGGDITAENSSAEGIGAGARFTLRIPLTP